MGTDNTDVERTHLLRADELSPDGVLSEVELARLISMSQAERSSHKTKLASISPARPLSQLSLSSNRTLSRSPSPSDSDISCTSSSCIPDTPSPPRSCPSSSASQSSCVPATPSPPNNPSVTSPASDALTPKSSHVSSSPTPFSLPRQPPTHLVKPTPKRAKLTALLPVSFSPSSSSAFSQASCTTNQSLQLMPLNAFPAPHYSDHSSLFNLLPAVPVSSSLLPHVADTETYSEFVLRDDNYPDPFRVLTPHSSSRPPSRSYSVGSQPMEGIVYEFSGN